MRDKAAIQILIASYLIFGLQCVCGIADDGLSIAERDSRWNAVLVRDVMSWYPLLEDYANTYETKVQRWAEKRKQLEGVIQQYPKSEYVADLRLAVACGIALYEKDSDAAIKALEQVRRDYPKQGTILSLQLLPMRWQFDRHWLETVPTLMTRRPDGKIIVRRIGEGKRTLSAEERATLAYFEHLNEHPKLTKDVASLYIAALYRGQKKDDKAIETLETLVKERGKEAAATNESDRKASISPDGVWIVGIARPWVVASEELMEYYASKKDYGAAMSVGKRAVDTVSKDGWYWQLNGRLGDIYKAKSQEQKSVEAAVQYELAIKGAIYMMRRYAEFVKAREGTIENINTVYWTKVVGTLKGKLKAAGGTVESDGDDLKAAKEVFSTPTTAASQSVSLRDEALQRLKNAYFTKTPEGQTKPKAVDEVVKWWLATVQNRPVEETTKIKSALAVGLAELAMKEYNGPAKKNAISGIRAILATKGDRPKDEKQEKAVAEIVKKLQDAASQKDTSKIEALQQELVKLPESSVVYVAEWCCSESVDNDVSAALQKALWNRGTPDSLDSLLSSLEKCKDGGLARSITSSIKASIARMGLANTASTTRPVASAPASPASTSAILGGNNPRPFELRSNVNGLLKKIKKIGTLTIYYHAAQRHPHMRGLENG